MYIITCLLFLTLFYGLCAFALFSDKGYLKIREVYKSFTRIQMIVLAVILAAAGVFVVYWVRKIHFVCFWDYGAYWSYSINRMNYMFSHSFTDTIKSLYESINNDDYNILIPTIIALPLKVLGYSYPRYIVINCLLFLFPTFLVQGMLAAKLLQNSSLKTGQLFILTVFLAVCFPANYYAVFSGYADIAFLLPMSIAMYLLVDFDFGKISVSRDASIALLLVLIWLLRRYTIYFIIGYVAALLVRAICFVLFSNRKQIGTIIINFAVIGGISLGILFVFFRKFLIRALLTDYGSMYSAYDTSLSVKIETLVSSFGYISGIIILITGILCFCQKRNIGIYVSLLTMLFTETVIFWQTQSMSVQHRMILNLPVFMLCVLVLDFSDREAGSKVKSGLSVWLKRAAIMICIFMLCANFAKTYISVFSEKGTNSLFAERYHPFQRDDIEALNDLAGRLNELTANTDDYIYIAASGVILNSDILRKLYMPYSDNAIPHMFSTCDVDLRDGFPSSFLQAKYVVTTDPVQLHLFSGQEVVSYLAYNVQDRNSYIGCHFEYMEQVELDNGISAKIYRKKNEFSENDLQQLRDYFNNLYPGNDSLFTDRIK